MNGVLEGDCSTAIFIFIVTLALFRHTLFFFWILPSEFLSLPLFFFYFSPLFFPVFVLELFCIIFHSIVFHFIRKYWNASDCAIIIRGVTIKGKESRVYASNTPRKGEKEGEMWREGQWNYSLERKLSNIYFPMNIHDMFIFCCLTYLSMELTTEGFAAMP